MFTVEVVYALLHKHIIKNLEVDSQTTINQTITQSGILEQYSEIDLSINKVGIFNQIKKLDDVVNAGDRIEIYRPLQADPKDVRRKRAVKQKNEGVIK